MAKVEILMPRMGESIFECTVLNWLKKVGETVEVDDMILEVATDKIDTEIGSSHAGTITEILVKEGETAVIGKPICIIETEVSESKTEVNEISTSEIEAAAQEIEAEVSSITVAATIESPKITNSNRFYSPLVQNIAKEEGISQSELDSIQGTGQDSRVTKDDLLAYIKTKANPIQITDIKQTTQPVPVSVDALDEIITMDRMRKMIADRMVDSKRISPHVTSFVETDMTNASIWRERVKGQFKKETGENITFTPILIEAVVKAIKDFPMINIQVDGDKIIRKGHINVGMAVALPSGNLIVPVIHDADQYSIIGLTKKINDLTNRARNNKLKADDLADGTYTVSNIGSFGNISGTPIIMQPQVAIIAFGVIQKKPAVIETPQGDLIGIRQKMIISHSYDHRVVDGSLGGQFVKRVSDYLENFDLDRKLF
ncbi:MAG: dihydrolipoamide acetyltransferase family protein [Spirosomataceae bacterium]